MFKSLIEQYKLFVKGATGKDRHQKLQLNQQLTRLQAAYDCLQEDCDRLKREHDTLKRSLDQLQKKHAQLKRDRNDLNALFNYADKENQALDAEMGELRSHFQTREQTLEADNATLQSRVIYLEHKLGLRAYDPSSARDSAAANDPQQNKPPAGRKRLASDPWLKAADLTADLADDLTADLTADLSDLTIQAIVDLSDVSLALVGGHETTHREVTEELKKYGLKRCVHIPPHSRESNSRHQIKDKIGNCDLIVTITSYIDHSVSNCVKQLQDTQMLTGEVIRVHCHGKSGVVREVLQYFST
jgi:chromosome segregation ATPase